MALQFDGPQAEHALGADPLLFFVPDHLVVPLPLFFCDLFEKALADRNRQADACITFIEIKPCNGQGFGTTEGIPRRDQRAAPLTQQESTCASRSCQCEPFGERRRDQLSDGVVFLDVQGQLCRWRYWLECPELSLPLSALLSDAAEAIVMIAWCSASEALKAVGDIAPNITAPGEITFTEQRSQIAGQCLQSPTPCLDQHQAQPWVHAERRHVLTNGCDLALICQQSQLLELLLPFLKQRVGWRFQPLELLAQASSPLRQVQDGGLGIRSKQFRGILRGPASFFRH